MLVNLVEAINCPCTVLGHVDGLLQVCIPTLQKGTKLVGDGLRMARIIVPGDIVIDTNCVHVWCLPVWRKGGGGGGDICT